MAVEPVFIATLDDLKSRVRLSDAYHEDALSIIDDAVTTARLRIYDHLGSVRVTEIVALTPTENPATDDELTRTKAEIVEVKLVRRECAKSLPVLFADSSKLSEELWNTDSFLRELGTPTFREQKPRIDKLLQVIESDIVKLLNELVAGSEQTDEKILTFLSGPEEPVLLGSSVPNFNTGRRRFLQ